MSNVPDLSATVTELSNHREFVVRGDWFDCQCGEQYLVWECHIAEVVGDIAAAALVAEINRTIELDNQLTRAQRILEERDTEIKKLEGKLASRDRSADLLRISLTKLRGNNQNLIDYALRLQARNQRRGWWWQRQLTLSPERVLTALADNPSGQIQPALLAELEARGGTITCEPIGLKFIATYIPPRRWGRREGGIVTAVSDAHEGDALMLLRIAIAQRGMA